MALNIRNPRTEQLAITVAELTGETKTTAVTVALKERLERIQRDRSGKSLVDELNEIALRCAALPVIDDRSDDEIMGYNEDGLPS
ncbi:MAG: type II toxin-antitoxin system VapB family antitoxin [Acidiferrobacterales bacterium]|nr:type II toxin-antitoxin system VapB family antitoxin [Acidiferrobacterales bacterium]